MPEWRRVAAQVRYRQTPEAATLTVTGEGAFRLDFDDPQFAVTVGQSAVASRTRISLPPAL